MKDSDKTLLMYAEAADAREAFIGKVTREQVSRAIRTAADRWYHGSQWTTVSIDEVTPNSWTPEDLSTFQKYVLEEIRKLDVNGFAGVSDISMVAYASLLMAEETRDDSKWKVSPEEYFNDARQSNRLQH
jgi:hypothetical protein